MTAFEEEKIGKGVGGTVFALSLQLLRFLQNYLTLANMQDLIKIKTLKEKNCSKLKFFF